MILELNITQFLHFLDYAVGFGGKFGVQTDRQDACAVGWDHKETTPAHASQVDHKKVRVLGYGGRVF